MSRNCYPTLLNKKATMLGSLTRYDLVIIGVSYLILSWMKVSGLYSLVINALILVLIKFAKGKFQIGFFRNINGEYLIESKNIQSLFEKGGLDE